MQTPAPAPRYRALTRNNIHTLPGWDALSPEIKRGVAVVSTVLPFKTNEYVARELIDWDRVPDDPMFQLTFVQPKMLSPAHYAQMAALLDAGAGKAELRAAADSIRLSLNPHPAGQLSHNVPTLDGRRLEGIQHKYEQTVLFFPAQGQTCHAYCTFCFRWAQFVGLEGMKFEARETADLTAYLRVHPEVRDVLLTGGDPMVMRTRTLARYLDPLLADEFSEVDIRIGTKALSYWPRRFVSDGDADELLRLFERIVSSGRHLAIMAHVNHPRELSTDITREAIRRIRNTGAEIRLQSPLLRRINDSAEAWTELWSTGVRLGCIPYYMFVERDTGPRDYFAVPLEEAWTLFRAAYQQVSGLARTVRGPSMSALPGKVMVDGVVEIAGEKVFALQFVQARDPDWVRRPFYAAYDAEATWLDELRPAFGAERFFFESETSYPQEQARTAGGRSSRTKLEVVY